MDIQTLISGITDIVSSSEGPISSAIAARNKRYEYSDNYLANALIEKGRITKEDEEIAAKLYLIPSMRRRVRNYAKVIEKADKLFETNLEESKEPVLPSEDWMDYFMDKSSLISEEEIQNIWAAILAGKCKQEGSGVSKVMLDRLALLDATSAENFGMLCELVVRTDLSSGSSYYIPLYIRDDDLAKFISKGLLSFEEACTYQARRPSEDEMELLQEIGLIYFADLNDEGEIFQIEPFTFSVQINGSNIFNGTSFSEEDKEYHQFFITGCARFTMIGQALYEAIKGLFSQDEKMLVAIVKAYYRNFAN